MSSSTEIRKIPLSTYRFQFHKAFPMQNALEQDLVQYLSMLGISYCYSSPLLKARGGSTHGYDVVDPSIINPEIATPEQFKELSDKLKAKGLGLLLDIVPNHVGINDSSNRWWMNVLEHGKGSIYANHFDINWNHPKHTNKLIVPTLGAPSGRVLENGELVVTWNEKEDAPVDGSDVTGAFQIHYYSLHLPIDPTTLPEYILEPLLEQLKGKASADKLSALIAKLKQMPHRDQVGELTKEHEEQRKQRATLTVQVKNELSALMKETEVKDAVQIVLAKLNGVKQDSKSFNKLSDLVEAQAYNLTYWKSASDEINYRRFFEINDLMAIKAETQHVFDDAHRLVFEWLKEGKVNALRLDHPDGLFNPKEYCVKLQQSMKKVLPNADDTNKPLYVLIEKILEPNEVLSDDWPVHGTTGYEFMNQLNGVFVDTDNESAFRKIYQSVAGDGTNFEDMLYTCKKLILDTSMESELHSLGLLLEKIARQSRLTKDYSLKQLKRALAELVAFFPVYRTYIVPEDATVTKEDRHFIEYTLDHVRRLSNFVDSGIVDFIASLLLCEGEANITPKEREERRFFIMKFQQLTGPVMAKGLEDTAFYRFFLLTSLNEVGGHPDRFGITMEAFHKENQFRAAKWSNSMSATSTHDTKRSEDVRARINVLSEMPDTWFNTMTRWQQLNEQNKQAVPQYGMVPEPNEEYFIYQTIVGAWPMGATSASDEFIGRINAYMMKAFKEAKWRTSWTLPNQAYEDAVKSFVEKTLKDSNFVNDFLQFYKSINQLGKLNSLAQTVLKFTSPGVPDTYQGTELWDFSLVDPDNRRPVDYSLRKKMLSELKQKISSSLDGKGNLEDVVKYVSENTDNGMVKLFTTERLLSIRKEKGDLFSFGTYVPLVVDGQKSKNVVAFSREHEDQQVVVVVGRFFSKLYDSEGKQLSNVWENNNVKWTPNSKVSSTYRDIFTGAVYSPTTVDGKLSLSLSDILKHQPFAVLESLPSSK